MMMRAAAALHLVLIAAAATPLPDLPLPRVLIPDSAGVAKGGRLSVHGWLWLPTECGDEGSSSLATESDDNEGKTSLTGYFYHHTPEFFEASPHNFVLMAQGKLRLHTPVDGLPTPASGANTLGTEYVFTPPAFGLDDLILGTRREFEGPFSNGSFDTPQRVVLTNATLSVAALPVVHYLRDLVNETMPTQAFLSFPRRGGAAVGAVRLYWLHLLWSAPDFDQVIHVEVSLTSCDFRNGDSAEDAVFPGATFATDLPNEVGHRLNSGRHTVSLLTERGRGSSVVSTCEASVVEEVHCVLMPDSFEKCPPPVD